MYVLSQSGHRRVAVAWAMGCTFAAGFLVWLAIAAPLRSKDGEPAKGGRTPWKTSRVVGSPDPPPPYKVVRAFPKLKFEHPLLMARPPGSDRLFVGEQAGVLYSFSNKPG